MRALFVWSLQFAALALPAQREKFIRYYLTIE
jgi:hypothetical protein